MEVKKVNSKEDLLKCKDVILELRPHLKGKDITAIFKKMQGEDFHIIFIEENNKAVAFLGYRFLTMFFSGDTLYIDDLCTLPTARNKGYAGKLLDHVIVEAKTKNINAVTLDSGVQRFTAHKLYLNKNFQIESHHFHLQLT